MLDDATTIEVTWVRGETETADFVAAIETAGGSVKGELRPFDPPSDELDDYSDAQFEPMLIIATVVSVGFLVKTISQTLLEHQNPGGRIIDVRQGGLVERPAPYLEHKTLVLITDSGIQKFGPAETNEAIEAFKSIVGQRLG